MSKSSKKKDPHAEREAQKYEHPIPSREYIIEHLNERGKAATYPQLLEELHLRGEEQEEALRRRLIAMVRDGQLLKNRKGAYGPVANMELIAGRVIGHKDGFGFMVPDNGGDDLFLGPREMRHVFHGDRVLTRVSSVDTRGKREASIVEVLERNTQQLVGKFYCEAGAAYVEPSNQRMTHKVLIPPDMVNDAKHGQIVVAAVTAQPTKHTLPLGEIVEVMGDHMAAGMEINIAIRSHELPYVWPEEVLFEAGKFPAHVTEEAIKGRNDLRRLPFVTIDGEDAKDFDDAVYCESREKGGWKLYVAIADVSAYVTPNSPLDKEAYKRGNSVYFPGRVIPMLPEALSNNLCSLNPQVDRLVMVCEMTIHQSGRVMDYEFSEAVIHSHARLTYTQVHEMMEKKDRKAREQFKAQLPNLEQLYALFEVLHKARQERGAIDFDMPETQIVFGANRKIKEIVPYERYGSHRVIEECMLAANISAARYLEKNKHPALYRVHEGPSEEKLNDLRKFTQEMGLKMPGHRDPVPGDYAHVLRIVADRPDFNMIQTVLLRSMSQAVYSPENKGHFGLAYDAYAHFTSPIRRYPDLLVHRAIKQLINKQSSLVDDAGFVRAGEHCSMTERRADDATRDAKDWLKCEFMMDKVGQEFEGSISGVTNFGLFVELADIYVEGLVHITTLPDDYYQFDSVKHTLIGERTNRRFRLGDPIKIQVARVDLDQGEMDFVLAGEKNRVRADRSKGQPAHKRDKKTSSRRKSGPREDSKKPGKKRKRK